MPDGGGQTEWDFLTLVELWNLFGLPVLLGVVAIADPLLHRGREPDRSRSSGSATIRRIGLIHYILGLRALIQLVRETLTFRAMGILQSNPITGVIFPVVSLVVNVLLGRGLRRLRPRARRWAIAWYVLSSLIAFLAVYWMWHYHAAVHLADWPDHLVGKGTPLFLLIVMLLPRTRHVFFDQSAGREESGPTQRPACAPQPSTTAFNRGWPILSLMILLLLIVACSTLVVDAADWLQGLLLSPGPDTIP